jgi:hypothetical protein
VSAGAVHKTVGWPTRRTHLSQSGFDAESDGLRRGVRPIKSARDDASDDTATDDERYARDTTEGEHET